MANLINYLSLTGLQKYDASIKSFIETKVNEGDAKSFKYVDLVDGVLKFYTINPLTEGAVADFEIELPEQDLTHLMALVKGATKNNVAIFGDNGQVVDSNIAVGTIATKAEVKSVSDEVDALKGRVKTLEDNSYDDSEVRDLIQANGDAIGVLNGGADTDGSVAHAIAENDIFVTDIVTVNSLGGIAAGSNLNGMTTHEILNTLLFPYVSHTLGTPSRVPNTTSALEKGNNQTITSVSVSVTKKSKPITSVALYNGNTLIAEKTGTEVANGGTITFSGISVSVPSTNVVLTVKATDANGTEKTANTAGWTFVYPYYYGTCGEDDEITEDLVKGLNKKVETKGNKRPSFTASYKRVVFAYPMSYGKLVEIKDPNNFGIDKSFTIYEKSITGLDKTAQDYYVYVNEPSTMNNFEINFKHTA